ncbi:WYL domain-containing protein [Nocardioides marinus]|uniref:Proteasome accessory factor C n=1 Tax=Nocardioides marinus TaxID=374514 RepID=A0A7Y9YDG1_9ACTN|nr:WYL domain-containing protein [Nocardioides marinus]NYI10206.1 proteasome accessory factor C [Nocardioides marinus]
MSTTPAPQARDQVARLLTLVPYLHARGTVHVDQAARELGTTPTQLVKDLKVLLMCGLPGGYPDDLIDVDLDALEEGGDGVIRVSNADYLARPLRLTPTEASAVIVALRALRNSAGPDTREVLDRTLAKLEAAAAHGGVGRIDPGQGAADADVALLARRLQEAVERGRQVRLRYYVPSRDEVTVRVVDPHAVTRGQGFAYLDADCHSAGAPRLFRLDRIQDAEVLDTAVSSTPRPGRELPAGVIDEQESVVATLRLAPEARWVVDYYPVLATRPVDGADPDGALEVDLRVADARWLTRLVLRLAPYAEVVAPQEFTDSSVAAARATLGLYS